MTRAHSRKERPTVRLGTRLDKSLFAYAAAASAAGVGMLALAQPAAAKIVYTPANTEITPKTKLNLDLNHDGIADFQINDLLKTHNGSGYNDLKALPHAKGNAIWGSGKYASVLSAGVSVGPSGQFLPGHEAMVIQTKVCDGSGCNYRTKGPWENITREYLGLKFSIHGETHYGWARFNVTVDRHGVFAVLTGYAYETVANKPIVTGKTKGEADHVPDINQTGSAPEPASLGRLARGAEGLAPWRKSYAIHP
jgi:hypothetical protein